MAGHQLSVTFDDDTFARVEAVASQLELSKAHWVRAVVEDMLPVVEANLLRWPAEHTHAWEPFGEILRCSCGAIGA